MKTAYELAMERLNQTAPARTLSNEQKKEIAELDSKYAAKIAEREITLRAESTKAQVQGNMDEAVALERQLAEERQKLLAELEEKKEQVRQSR